MEKSKSLPYVILHMVTSVDGKVTGTYLSDKKSEAICEEYYRIHREYSSQGFICGRITMEGSFTHGYKPDLSRYNGKNPKRSDHVAEKADFYAISVDPRGVVGWKASRITDDDDGYNNAHIIEVLSDRASDEYVSYLEEIGVSYIFCGKERIDTKILCEKLYKLFGIKKIMLEGGGVTNTSFLENDLIDEISLVVAPMIDCDGDSVNLFDTKTSTHQGVLRAFRLEVAEALKENAIWLKYRK